MPQPLCSVSAATVRLPRPDPDHHPPVVVPEAWLPLCPFLLSRGLLQVDLSVSAAAAARAQAFSILSLFIFDAMSRIGGLHPLRQLARLTGATGASDPSSSGPGPAAGGSLAPSAPASNPADGAAVAAPAAAQGAAGGDGSAGPAAGAPGPAHDGSGGDGAAAPPAPVSKSSGAAFLAAVPGPTPKTPPQHPPTMAGVSAAPPTRSSLSSGIDIFGIPATAPASRRLPLALVMVGLPRLPQRLQHPVRLLVLPPRTPSTSAIWSRRRHLCRPGGFASQPFGPHQRVALPELFCLDLPPWVPRQPPPPALEHLTVRGYCTHDCPARGPRCLRICLRPVSIRATSVLTAWPTGCNRSGRPARYFSNLSIKFIDSSRPRLFTSRPASAP